MPEHDRLENYINRLEQARQKLEGYRELIKYTNKFFGHQQAPREAEIAQIAWSWEPELSNDVGETNAFMGWGGKKADEIALISTLRKHKLTQIIINPLETLKREPVTQENAHTFVHSLFYGQLPEEDQPTPAQEIAIYTYGIMSEMYREDCKAAISDEELKKFIQNRFIADLRSPISPEFQFEALDSLDLRRSGQRFRDVFKKYPDLWRSFIEALIVAAERNDPDEVPFIGGLAYKLQGVARGRYPEIPEDLKEKFAPAVARYMQKWDITTPPTQ